MGIEQHAKLSINPLVSESRPDARFMCRWPAVTDRFTAGSHGLAIDAGEPSGHTQPDVHDALGCSLYAPKAMKELSGVVCHDQSNETLQRMDTTNAVSTGEPIVARATEEPAGAEAAHRLTKEP